MTAVIIGVFYYCLIWLLTFIGATTFHTGILPVFIVCVIWLTSMVGYSVTAMKLEKIKHS